MSIPKNGPVIAIDGPAGTGKSSVTKRLCERLMFTHIDTGALYRSIALLCIESDCIIDGKFQNDKGPDKASQIARNTILEFRRVEGRMPINRIFAAGRDVTDFVRTPEVSAAASLVSAVPEVRSALLGLQRALGCQGASILEGRDIGTVIFPDADVKFFLTASVEERAKRRRAELENHDEEVPSLTEVKNQIIERDKGDSTRKVAPLKKAPDAIEIDTTHMTLDEVVKKMEAMVRSRIGDRR